MLIRLVFIEKVTFFMICGHFALFLVFLYSINAFASQDPLYDKINSQESIRMADSLFVHMDDYQNAARFYLQAIEEIKPNESELLAYCNIKLANAHISMEQPDNAIPFLNAAKKIISNLDDPNKLIQEQYNLYYGKYLLRIGELDSAAKYIDRSIELKRKYFSQDSLGLAESLFFRAEIFDDQSKLTMAEEIYREMLTIYENNLEKNDPLLGRLYSTMATCLRDQLDYTNALDHIERALQIFQSDSINNFNRLVVATFYYASIYSGMKEYEASIPIYLDLLNLIQNNDQLNRFLRYSYTNLPTSYTYTNQFGKAKYYIDEYYKFVTANGSISPEDEAYYFSIRGQYYLQRDNYTKARQYLFKAIDLYQNQLNNILEHTLCIELVGDMYFEMDLPDSALYYFQRALNVYLPNFKNEDIFSNPESQDDPDQREIFDILYRKARAFRKFYNLEQNLSYLKVALHIYNQIDKLNDDARNSNLRDASLLILNDYYHGEYERAIDCAYELYQRTGDTTYLNNAFTLMEKSKSMLLFKSLALAERSNPVNLPYSIKRREDSLRMLNVDYEQRIRREEQNEVPDQEHIVKLKGEKFQITQKIYNLKVQISKEFPTYYQIRYDSIVKDLDDFGVYCKRKDLLGIEYFWGDSVIYQIATNGEISQIIKIPRTGKFNKVFRNLLRQLSDGIDRSQIDADYRAYNDNAYEVFQYLLGNLKKDLWESSARLLIIPDGMLAQLPFEALLTSPGDTSYTDYSNLPYLINNSTIGYTYSINLLLNTEKEKKISDKNLLAFSYSGLNILADDIDRSENTKELPYAATELRAIKKVMHGRKNHYLFDTDATEDQFKKLAPDFQILHLAVHGYADTLEGNNSRLEFKQGNDIIEDNNLYMYELYGMDLSNSGLAVLSACETGIGKDFRGEGVFSMARGFTYAGCPSIIMSLWRVSDVHSSTIMENFYRSLKKGYNAPEALRSSKLDFIKKQEELKSHPANWASFVYLGEEFNYQSGVNLILILSIGIFLVVILFIYFKFFQSKF